MGHNVSAVHGVKSPDFYTPGNAVNEIWIDDFELISRLPFGDSDLGQASWPPHDWPKIPWHQFIIPLKRDLSTFNATMSANMAAECTKPRIFGIGSEWSSPLYFVSAAMIIIGFALIVNLSYNLHDMTSTVDNYGNDKPLRYVLPYLQPQNIWRWIRSRLSAGWYFLGVATLLFAFGFPMATSAVRCVDGLEVFSITMPLVAFTVLEFVIMDSFILGRAIRKAVTRKEGDKRDRVAYARYPQLAQIAALSQMSHNEPSEHGTDEAVDIEKTAGSEPRSTQV